MKSLSKENILQLRKQIELAKTKEAIETLLLFDTSHQNPLLILSSRLVDLKQKEWMGIIDSESYGLEKNKITYLFLDILEEIEKEISATESLKKQTTQNKTLVFKTKNQQIYLLKSPQGLECHMEDTNPAKTGHQWTISKTDAKKIVQNTQVRLNPNHTARSGTYSLGARKNWLYSKKLFPDPVYFEALLIELLKEVSA